MGPTTQCYAQAKYLSSVMDRAGDSSTQRWTWGGAYPSPFPNNGSFLNPLAKAHF